MEKDRVELIKYKVCFTGKSIESDDVKYLIKEVERLRAVVANYEDNKCKVWSISDVSILSDK